MGIWSTITSIFTKKEKEMENSKKSALQELTNGGIDKNGGHPLGYMPPNTPKKKYESGITYSCRKYLGSKKNYKKVERAGYKTLSMSPNFTSNILSYRICLKNNLPIQVLKTENNFPLRFPSIIDLINVMGYKK